MTISTKLSRRGFLKTSVAASVGAGLSVLPVASFAAMPRLAVGGEKRSPLCPRAR